MVGWLLTVAAASLCLPLTQGPVAAPFEDRKVGLIPEHHAEALRHAMVPGRGLAE